MIPAEKIEAARRRIPRRPYPPVGRVKFMATVKPLMTSRQLENVEAAYVFAKHGHRTQIRDDGKRYFEHPKAVAWIAVQELWVTDWRAIVLCLIHDVKEDTHLLSWERVEKNFGPGITKELKLLTKDPKDGYIMRMKRFGNTRVLLVKLCDRLHNLRTLAGCSRKKQKKQVEETENVHLPLANLLIHRLSARERWKGEYLRAEIGRICQTYNEKTVSRRRTFIKRKRRTSPQ